PIIPVPSRKIPRPDALPLRVAFLWHQHQPYYRAGKKFLLPWAWLHATKDYLEMAQHVERQPRMKATINFVPSLIKQIEEYLSGDGEDEVVTLLAKPSGKLTDTDKDFILEHFFLCHAPTMIYRSPRFRELYERYQHTHDRAAFSEQDF